MQFSDEYIFLWDSDERQEISEVIIDFIRKVHSSDKEVTTDTIYAVLHKTVDFAFYDYEVDSIL